MDPKFNSMMFMPQFQDNSWITDTTTFCPDYKLLWEKSALSMQLSGMQNLYFNMNPYPNVDTGTLLAGFWNNAYQAANASLATTLGSFPAMQMPFAPTVPVQQTQQTISPAPKTDLTDAEKEDFEAKQTEYNELIAKYENIDKTVAEKLGIDSVIESAKKAFAKADTPEKISKCLKDINTKISSIIEEASVEDLKLLLPKQDTAKKLDGLEAKIEELYIESTDFDTVHNLICGAEPIITSDNVIEEMNARQGYTCLIDELTSKGSREGDKLKQVVRTLVGAIRTRSAQDSSIAKDTSKERIALIEAHNLYSKYSNERNRENLVKAYIALYNAVRAAEAEKIDAENERYVKTLPDILKEEYLKDGKLKSEYKIPVINDGFVLKGSSTLVGQIDEEIAEAEQENGEQKYEQTAFRTAKVSNNVDLSDEYVDGVTGAAPVVKSVYEESLDIANSYPKLR